MKKNRLLSLLLVLVMVLGMLPGPALAVEAQEDYATLEQLEAAFEEVGETDDVDAALAALDAYLAVYDRLSDEDKEANAEALAMAQAYRETLVAGKEAEENEEEYEDPEIELLYGPFNSVPLTLPIKCPGLTGSYSNVVYTWMQYIDRSAACGSNTNASYSADVRFVDNGTNYVMVVDVTVGNWSTSTTTNYTVPKSTHEASTASGRVTGSLSFNTPGGNTSPITVYGGHAHKFTVQGAWETAPDCIHDGVAYFTCSCGQGGSQTKTVTGSKLGHSFPTTWTDGCTSHEDAGCTQHSHVCTRCNGTLSGGTETANHTYPTQWTVVTPATTTSKGREKKVCTACGHTIYQDIDKVEEPTTADYTVNWYDTDGNPLKAPETRKGTVDETVSATGADKSIAGYIYLEDRSTPSAELAASGTTLTLVFAKKITVTWLKEDGTQIKQIEIPNGDDSYKSEYPSDPSTTGKWGAPKTDADGNITIRWEESTKPEIVTKTVRIFKYFVGPTVEQVQAIKDNFSITYTYVLNGQTETKTLYGRDVALSTEFHDGAYDDDAYLGLPVLYWDVQLKMNKDSTPQDESDAGMISFTESGKEVTGWTWYDFDEAEGWENETGFSQAQPIYDGHISIGLGNYYKGSKEITIQKLFNGEGLTAENLPGDFALNLTQYVNGATNKTLSANTAEKITVDGKPGYQWKVSADVLAAYDWTYCYVEEENTTINGYTLTGTSGWEAEDWNDGIDHHYFMVTPAGDQVFTIINSYKKDTVTPEPEKVTVTFKDGYDNTEIPDSKITDWTKGEEVPEDRYPTVPVHEDKDFDGWEVETDGDGNITITAKWKDKTVNPGPDPEPEPEEPTPTYYTVIYTDGVAGEEIFLDQVNRWLTWNEATPAFNGTPEREGWTFLGWSPAVADRVRGSVTYVAQWQENEPVVTPEPTETPAETGEGEDLEENDTPLTEEPELPGKNEGDPEAPEEGEDLEDADTPLAEVPAEEAEELEENDVPLADVPQTGDDLWLWSLLTLCSAAGLATLLPRKKGKREA